MFSINFFIWKGNVNKVCFIQKPNSAEDVCLNKGSTEQNEKFSSNTTLPLFLSQKAFPKCKQYSADEKMTHNQLHTKKEDAVWLWQINSHLFLQLQFQEIYLIKARQSISFLLLGRKQSYIFLCVRYSSRHICRNCWDTANTWQETPHQHNQQTKT